MRSPLQQLLTRLPAGVKKRAGSRALSANRTESDLRSVPAPFFALAVALIVLAANAQAAAPRLPDDWLVTVSSPNAVALLAKAEQVAELLNVQSKDFAALRLVNNPRLEMNRGPALAGFAAPKGKLEELYPFAIVPTPVETIVELLGGEVAGEVGVCSVGGLELTVQRVDRVSYLAPSGRDEPLSVSQQPTGDLAVAVSQLGLTALRTRVATRRRQQGVQQRVALNQMGWPPSTRWLDAAIAGNEPLAERLAEVYSGITISLSLDKEAGLTTELTGALKEIPEARSEATPGVELPPFKRAAIARIHGGVKDGSLDALADLLLAYSQGRPDLIDEPAYPAEAYADVSQAAMVAVRQVQAVDATLLSRLPSDPFYSNRVAVLRVEDEHAFAKAIEQSVDAWNLLVADARFKLKIDSARVQLSPNLPDATRYTIDVMAALGGPVIPEVRDIMRRCYGEQGVHQVHVQPLGDGRMLVGELPVKQLKQVLDDLPGSDPQQAAGLHGEWDLGRYADWQNAIQAELMAQAIGFRPREKVDAAPAKLRVSLAEGVLRIQAEAPWQTIRQLAPLVTPQR